MRPSCGPSLSRGPPPPSSATGPVFLPALGPIHLVGSLLFSTLCPERRKKPRQLLSGVRGWTAPRPTISPARGANASRAHRLPPPLPGVEAARRLLEGATARALRATAEAPVPLLRRPLSGGEGLRPGATRNLASRCPLLQSGPSLRRGVVARRAVQSATARTSASGACLLARALGRPRTGAAQRSVREAAATEPPAVRPPRVMGSTTITITAAAPLRPKPPRRSVRGRPATIEPLRQPAGEKEQSDQKLACSQQAFYHHVYILYEPTDQKSVV